MGMITVDDLTLVLSNSGETMEIVTIIPIVKRIGVRMIAMTGRMDSTLAVESDVCLDVSVAQEACPHNLAPTASTTAALVMGDALAVAVQKQRGFSAQDFARTLPGGMLGKRLLLYARDIMHTGTEMPLVGPEDTMAELLLEMSAKSLGMGGGGGQAEPVARDVYRRRPQEIPGTGSGCLYGQGEGSDDTRSLYGHPRHAGG